MLDYDTASDLSEMDELDALYGMHFDGMPDEEDERYYCENILSGLHDEEEEARGEWAEAQYDADREYWFEGDERSALDAYERTIYGD